MPRTRQRDAVPRGALRALLLAALAESDLHGYALARKLERRARGTLKIREGSLYPALHELELEGAVEASWTRAPDGRRRRVYSLTRSGRRSARGARAEWLAIADMLHAILAT
ncbi:MAG TPA: helix-turn-helix transcriptional regulator [Kofleriaceae bacterium]|nr:helix-turn-helix transcriptional regulator [Kofleriaceae bacterium]